jgi:hypothetical protein
MPAHSKQPAALAPAMVAICDDLLRAIHYADAENLARPSTLEVLRDRVMDIRLSISPAKKQPSNH